MIGIKNWDYKRLDIDFTPLAKPNGKDKPSDIDMAYISKDGTLIIGEFKNEQHPFIDDGQKWIIEKYIDGWRRNAFAFLAIHNKYVQQGDEKVNAADCKVKEIYYKGIGWMPPIAPTTVMDIINHFRGGKQ